MTIYSIYIISKLTKHIYFLKQTYQEEFLYISNAEEDLEIKSSIFSAILYSRLIKLIEEYSSKNLQNIYDVLKEIKDKIFISEINVKKEMQFYFIISFFYGLYVYVFNCNYFIIIELMIFYMFFIKFISIYLSHLQKKTYDMICDFFITSFKNLHSLHLEKLLIEKAEIKKLNKNNLYKNFVLEEFDDKFVFQGSISHKKIALCKILKSLNKMKEYNLIFYIDKNKIDDVLIYIENLLSMRQIMIVQNSEEFFQKMSYISKDSYKDHENEIVLIAKKLIE